MIGDTEAIIIRVKNQDGDTLMLKLPWDADMEGMADAFRTIAYWLTFAPSTIDEFVPDTTREWAYVDESVDEPDEHGPAGDD